MDLTDYLRLLRRSWLTIAGATLAGLLAGAVLSLSLTPTYTAETRLFAATQNSDSIAELQQGNSFTQARIQSYAETAKSPLVLQPAIDSLGLETTPAELAGRVEATADVNTVLLNLSVTDPSPVQAAAIAQAVADSLIVAINELETASEDAESPVKLSIITPATAPASPSSPNVALNTVLGAVLGLIFGLALAVFRSVVDTKLRGEVDLRRVTDAPVLGGISFDSDATKKPLLTQAPIQSPRAESFRQIRTNLQFANVTHDTKAILVTSSLPGEGKSTTAVNLAIATAQAGQSVVLIDADLRRPRVSEYLGLERNAGLTTALLGRADLTDLLQPWGDKELYVLTSGQIPPNPSELLGSSGMRDLLRRLERDYDAVIIDAPPLLPVTDAAVLAREVGGVVMVVGSSKIKTTDLEKSLSSLELVGGDLLGVVMNLLPSRGPDAYSYTYYSSDQEPQKRGRKQKATTHSEGARESDFDEKVLRGLRR